MGNTDSQDEENNESSDFYKRWMKDYVFLREKRDTRFGDIRNFWKVIRWLCYWIILYIWKRYTNKRMRINSFSWRDIGAKARKTSKIFWNSVKNALSSRIRMCCGLLDSINIRRLRYAVTSPNWTATLNITVWTCKKSSTNAFLNSNYSPNPKYGFSWTQLSVRAPSLRLIKYITAISGQIASFSPPKDRWRLLIMASSINRKMVWWFFFFFFILLNNSNCFAEVIELILLPPTANLIQL